MKKKLIDTARGYILLLAIVFVGIFFAVGAAYVNLVTAAARGARADVQESQALALAEAGVDVAIYKLNQDPSYSGEENTMVGPGSFTTVVMAISGTSRQITSTGFVPDESSALAQKTIRVRAGIDASIASFHYGVQAGDGGLSLQNSATVSGSVFSNGPITGSNSNAVTGDVMSGGPQGRVDGIHADGSAWAHLIKNSVIGGNVYYQSIENTQVGGVSYSGSDDVATSSLPISEETIDMWESAASSGGIHSSPCPYVISSDTTLGPKKIDCDLTIQGGTVNLAGPVWVKGNITVKGAPIIRVSGSLAGYGVAVVADDPSDRTNKGIIDLQNSVVIQGGGSGSAVLFVSRNKSAKNGGNVSAIRVRNTVQGDLLVYAGEGKIGLENSIHLREVTGWLIEAKNTANITYDSGLQNAFFSSGPGGSWMTVPGAYSEQ